MGIPKDFHADWNRIAGLIVRGSLKLQPGERVILHVDPTYFPDLAEQVRIELVRAGAVELGCLLRDSPGLHAARGRLRRRAVAETRKAEDAAIEALFNLADAYIWLPTDWGMADYQTEEILTRWGGRSVHFHWITGIDDPHVLQVFSEMYERALFIDYAALDARQRRIIKALDGATVRVTDARGSDFTVEVARDAHFHHGNGDASGDFIARHARKGSARDREVELPCGLVRTVDLKNPSGRLVVPNQTYGGAHAAGRFVGTMTFEFADGRLKKITSEHDSDWVAKRWAEATGDRDRIAEISIGTNPELRMVPGISDVPYYGYGEGAFRIDLANNWESGGGLRSSFHQWLTFTDASLSANGTPVVERGRLVME